MAAHPPARGAAGWFQLSLTTACGLLGAARDPLASYPSGQWRWGARLPIGEGGKGLPWVEQLVGSHLFKRTTDVARL
jgi:hypothetical protein